MEGVLSMKKKVILIMVALTVAIAGCGTKNSDIVESPKETVAKVTDDKKTENQKKVSEKTIEKSEESELKSDETTIKADEKATAQQTTDANTSDKNNESNNSTSGSSGNSSSSSAGNNSSAPSSNTSSGGGNANNNSSNGSNSGNNTNNSNNNNAGNTSSNPAPTPAPTPQHEHTWVHVDATGHYETVTIQAAWDETVPVYEDVEHTICNVCGAELTIDNYGPHDKAHALAGEGSGWHSEWRYEQTGTQTIHHEAVTEQRWVEDTPAYDICSGCGATK